MAKEDNPVALSLSVALIPVAALIGSLVASIQVLDISPHLPLIFASSVVVVIGVLRGHSWNELQKGMVRGISLAMPSILILMSIGILIGVWIASGVVPLLIFFGLELLAPAVFLPATCVICAVVSLSTGSSWSTAGTVGVALIGVGQGLNFPLPMVAGAVVSGAYFGDKMSPLSETTNLAPAVVGSELFEHIRHMLWTSGPSIVISLIIYAIVGINVDTDSGVGVGVGELLAALNRQFILSPWLLLAPLCVIGLIVLKIPAIPAVLAGAACGGVLGVVIQGVSFGEMFQAAQVGFVAETGVTQVDELLSRGGLESMFWTIALILCSMGFGGLMETTGMLQRIASSILSLAKSTGQLVTAVVATCIGMNIIAPDQYLSIIVPGRMYKESFDKAGLKAKNLSRALEDSGTLTSALIPWNTCGVFMMGALLVSPFSYLPYAFFNLINPILSILLGFTGLSMEKVDKDTNT